MAGFSIDEVRDSFEADISGFLSRIEATGNELLASAALSSPDPPGSRGFASLGDFFHSLYGTSMLVGARSLAETAGRLERLSEAGLATLQKIESQQQEVRERYLASSAEPVGGTPETLRAIIAQEVPKWTKLVRALDLKAD